MSLITRCTACGTSFKVVPDQLKIGDGWVRCGQCNTVFDASAQLQELPVGLAQAPATATATATATIFPETESRLVRNDELAALLADPVAPPAMEPAAQALPIDMAPDEDADEGPASADAAPALAHPLQDLPAASPTPATTPSEAESPAAPSGSDPVLEFAPGSDADESPSPLLLQTSTQDTPLEMDAGLQSAPDLDGAVPGVTLETDAPDLGDLGFVRKAERKAFWRRPLVRVLLLLATLVLLGLLGLQLAVQQRDELAARFPRLQPALEMLCERWGCTIAPRQHIASIAIDSSSFNRAKGDVYQLSLTLKSSASTELATPAIELTLTDVQDQPILRRVLQPSDLGLAPVLAPQGELSASLPVSVTLEQGAARVAGYRLLAFYP